MEKQHQGNKKAENHGLLQNQSQGVVTGWAYYKKYYM
jgi:hypothetical protein